MNKTQINRALRKAIPINLGIGGRKRAIVLKAKNRAVVQDTGWTNNLITNSGLDTYCSESFLWDAGYCRVGSGNAAPANTDSSLVTQVAATNSKISGAAQSGVNIGDGYCYRINGWEFSEGVFSGQNLAEVGFSVSSASSLCSRSLFLDSGGSPTTVTVQSDEVLQVYYEFRVYWPTEDVNTSIVDTTTAVNHTVIIRASGVDFWNAQYGLGYTTSQSLNTYNGSLGTIDAAPSGSSGLSVDTYSKNTYTTGDYSRRQTWSAGLTRGNAVGGISAVRFIIGATRWQASFSPSIAKNDTKKWDATFEVSVSRASI